MTFQTKKSGGENYPSKGVGVAVTKLNHVFRKWNVFIPRKLQKKPCKSLSFSTEY